MAVRKENTFREFGPCADLGGGCLDDDGFFFGRTERTSGRSFEYRDTKNNRYVLMHGDYPGDSILLAGRTWSDGVDVTKEEANDAIKRLGQINEKFNSSFKVTWNFKID